jgi:hypothetical protein
MNGIKNLIKEKNIFGRSVTEKKLFRMGLILQTNTVKPYYRFFIYFIHF